jgi:prohibitin 2
MYKRHEVSEQMKKALEERAKLYYINIDDVAITHLTFSEKFLESVEAKQSAEQEAKRAEFIVEKALQEKKSIIIRAEGEAKAVELVGKSLNPLYLELKKVEGSLRVAEIIAGGANKAIIDADTLLMTLSRPLHEYLLKLDSHNTVKV